MNNTEIATKLRSEVQENISKFVYFVFSVTTVSIGFAITKTQSIKPSYWLIFWLLSIIAMCISLVFGIIHIVKSNQSRSLAADLLIFSDLKNDILQLSDSSLKSEVKKLSNSCSEPKTVQELYKTSFIRSLAEKAKNNGEELHQYIDKVEASILKADMVQLKCQLIMGLSSELDALNKISKILSDSNKFLISQLIALLIGYLLFIIWHISTIFISHIIQKISI